MLASSYTLEKRMLSDQEKPNKTVTGAQAAQAAQVPSLIDPVK